MAVVIPAAFFDCFFPWSFWLSSTLPRLICLAYVHGFYFLFYCVEVSSVVLCCVWCDALRCVVIYYVALCCDPLCCVCFVALRCIALHCVAIRCVPVVLSLLNCVALWSVVLRCDPLCCVALCCVALLTSSAFLVFCLPKSCTLVDILNQPHSLADNLYTRELDKLDHPYQTDKLNNFYLL